MKFYDVIIVGAGPAGLKCAEILSKTDLKVLLLEKNEIIGPKICAGGLSHNALKYIDLPKKMMGPSFNKIKINTPLSKSILKVNKKIVYMIDRKDLGQWQLKKLKKSNVEVKTNSRVTKIQKNKLIVNNSKVFKFKYLVGADGSFSIIRKYAGLEIKNAIAIQYIIPTEKYKDLEIFFNSKLFHSWYAWIFPHKKYVSIGCGCDPKILSPKKITKNFNKWLKEKNIDISKAEYQAWSISYGFEGYKIDNIYLVGDAAGLAFGFSGEGMYQALVSGNEIAKMIIDKKYVSKKMDQLIKEKKSQERILTILEKSGPLRNLEYEFLTLFSRNKWFARKIIDILG